MEIAAKYIELNGVFFIAVFADRRVSPNFWHLSPQGPPGEEYFRYPSDDIFFFAVAKDGAKDA